MKWSVKMPPLLESQHKLWRRRRRKKRQHVQFCLLGFPHCSCQLCSPWASRTTRYTPDKNNIKSLLHVVSSWASEIASALPIPFSPLEEIVLGLYFVERLKQTSNLRVCSLDHKAVSCAASEAWVCFISLTLDG